MSKILKARIRFDHKFNDGVYVHSTIINKINEMIDMGYTFVNE